MAAILNRRVAGGEDRVDVGERLWAWREPAVVLGVIVISVLVHGLNMFQYPALNRFDDEGVYLSQAWAVIREHQLSPYAYFYDHAPAGWVFLAVWMAISGGPHAFGLVADSGRVFMLLLHIAMVPLLYRLARKLGASIWFAGLAVVIFSASPLAVYYQRPMLLDNVMMFWVLLSLEFLLDDWGRLSRVALSGLCFGMAILSKETAAFLLPALLYFAIEQRQQHHGRFSVTGWVLAMLMVVSFYPLYALLRGELLPAGQSLRFFIFNIDTGPGLSLVDSVRWQATRTGGGFFNLHNQFWTLMRTDWMVKDPALFVAGAGASLVNLVRGFRHRQALGAGLLGLLPMVYLARGGVVFDFYILLAIPFFCLNLALLATWLCQRFRLTPSDEAKAVWRPRPGHVISAVAFLALAVSYVRGNAWLPLYQSNAGQVNRDAIIWIKQHVPAQSLIVGGSDVWTDLHEPGLDGPAFPNVQSHWKVGADPAIRDGVFHNDWHMVDYLVLSPQVKQDLVDANIQVAQQALQHAHLVKSWTADSSQLELWKVDKPSSTDAAMLAASSAFMTNHFYQSGAYVASDGTATSESQGYALLRDVWSNDRPQFDATWAWVHRHLMNNEGLPAWLWRNGAVADKHTASDADTDTALALLLAGKRWNDPGMTAAGTAMAQSIWTADVVTVKGIPYLAGGDWSASNAVIGLDPSYFAPYAYRVFQQVDPGHNWNKLIDSSYQVLFDSSSALLGSHKSAGLPPDWVGLDRATGKLVPFSDSKGDLSHYGYDAARTYWRVAIDARWTGDGRAATYLKQAGFIRDETARDGMPGAVYAHDGQPIERAPSVVGDTGALAALLSLDPAAAAKLYASQIVAGVNTDSGGTYWASRGDLYAQEWAWFGVALYGDELTDLWNHP